MAQLTFDEVLAAAKRLSHTEQTELMRQLSEHEDQTADDWEQLFNALVIHKPINPDLSLERTDWYD